MLYAGIAVGKTAYHTVKFVKNNKNVKILAEYMQDKRNINKLGSAFGIIGSKFSGIAVVQALIDGKITSKEALDYLFMGFAPAIGIQGSLMGYSGLNQLKSAFYNLGQLYQFLPCQCSFLDIFEMHQR